MKRLRYSPAAPPGRPKRLSRKTLAHRLDRTREILVELARRKADVDTQLDTSRSQSLRLAHELERLQTIIHGVTQPILDHAIVRYHPAADEVERAIPTWRISGTLHLGLDIDMREIHCLARAGTKEGLIAAIAERLAKDVYAHVLRTLTIA